MLSRVIRSVWFVRSTTPTEAHGSYSAFRKWPRVPQILSAPTVLTRAGDYPCSWGRSLRLMSTPLYKTFLIDRAEFRECLTCGAIVGNEVLHSNYHEQQIRPKRCPKCGLLDIGRHICLKAD
jgi:hypothetical protein